ncbi:hypothetical protein OUZ56_031994 [Daphnia magna]|uniref:Myb/SANT-like DNA-binding domain-containing protein n=1 Tax=Daphnia magna TaxID=35525 RepID=A0ABQ9ZVW4_9CRUS|nr:hypothetical protein OUZ56_031994 [Daphnia magna]
MEIESRVLEWWEKGITIEHDMEATELLLNLLKEKWSLLIDNKTNKKQIWNDIATGLSEQGYLVRGEDKGASCRTKWENLRKDYRTYISKFNQSGSSANEKRNPNISNKLKKFLACMYGGNNHSYRPPYISDSFNQNQQNPTKFNDIMKEVSSQKKIGMTIPNSESV